MFGEQAVRILREFEWTDVNMLAQELYAILSNARLPLYHEGPITLQQPAGSSEAGLQFRGYDDGPAITIGPRDNSISIELGPDGLSYPEEEDQPEDETTAEATVQIGTIRSGSGSTYTVRLTTGGDVEATHPSISEDETIPAGTTVVLASGVIINIPTWIGEEE